MSTAKVLLLGAIAGFTIFLGLPVARLRNPAPRLRALLNAVAVGILVFLLWDVLSHAVEPLENALTAAAVDHKGSWLRFAGLGVTFVACLGAGLLSLVYYDRALANRRQARFGPGAAAVEELRGGLVAGLTPAQRLALLLIIGFGLHNATEGFGIVAPLAGEPERPSWGFLAAMGVIGGGPTFVGTLVGQSLVNDTLFVAFLALAAGSILYVVVQLLNVAQRMGHKEMLMWGLLGGFLVGLATDFVLVAAGA